MTKNFNEHPTRYVTKFSLRRPKNSNINEEEDIYFISTRMK